MAKVKLNVNRTQWIDVPIPVGNDKFETIRVETQILKSTDEDKKIVDLIVGIDGLELTDDSDRLLSESAMIDAVKSDTQLSMLIANAWSLGNENLVMRQKTLLKPQSI